MANNPLYPTDSFEDRWGGLPVEAPRFNYTPNSSLIESEPRKEPFKLTPVDGDPFERAARRLRAPYKNVNDASGSTAYITDSEGKQIPFRSNIPLFVGKLANTVMSGATAARDAFSGEMQMTDPETGMPTDEAIRRSIDMASLGGPGGMAAPEKGVITGSGPVRPEPYKFTPVEASTVSDAFKNRYLPNGVPKPEAFDRVLPAVRNLDTGKISTTKRGNEHATILDKLWEKQGGDPGVSTLELYENMLPKHEMGFYDPKNKQFFPRNHPDWQNIDSPDLNPKEAMKSGQTFYEDSSKPAQMLSALRNNEGYKAWDAAANKAGFTTDAYHGATRPTSAFANAKINKPEFYSASDPKLAEDYATLGVPANRFNKGPADTKFNPQVLPLKLNTSNYHVVDAKGKSWDQVNENAIQEARQLGKSGVTVHNVKDPISETSPFQEPSTIHIALDPSTVRSRFAKFNPEDIKKNGLLLSDTQKPGMAMAALHDAPTFYSAVEHAVNNIKQQKMPADQWLGTLNNAKGVKPEEMDWLGLKEHLQSKGKEPVTKQEIQDLVNQNKVELKEVNKGELKFDKNSKYALPQVIKAVKQSGENPGELEMTLANDGDAYRALTKKFPELAKDEDWAAKVAKDVFGGDTMPSGTNKFSQYQLPGGENYREKLLTLPEKDLGKEKLAEQFYNFNRRGGEPTWQEASPEIRQSFMDAANQSSLKPTSGNQYRSSHWDEPNVLAHVRMNDRNIEGKKSLHIEEIQSDWHQAGRDKGYKFDVDKKLEDLTNEWGKQEIISKGVDKDAARIAKAKMIDITDEMNKLHDINAEGVPNAPFKKTWHELVLKRMIREAAEKGYDRISWTPGEAQAARYDLSKQVDKIMYQPSTGDLWAHKGSNRVLNEENVKPEDVQKWIGKEAADKIINNPTDKFPGRLDKSPGERMDVSDIHELSGEGLKVGGEGMKGFYDKMIPNAIEKIGKEHGIKVKQAETGKNPNYELENLGGKWRVLNKLTSERKSYNSKAEAEAAFSKNPVHYIDIPESLKNVAMKKGFPLFSGGHVFTPIVGNPHEPVNNSNDVPYGAGASNTPSGYPVNIDKRIPQYDERLKTSDGRRANLHKYLTIHEINEYKAMKAGMPYEKAHHEIATKAEKAAVEADGVKWSEYEHVIDGYLKETEHENPADPPKNLYLKPYKHDKKELDKMRNK